MRGRISRRCYMQLIRTKILYQFVRNIVHADLFDGGAFCLVIRPRGLLAFRVAVEGVFAFGACSEGGRRGVGSGGGRRGQAAMTIRRRRFRVQDVGEGNAGQEQRPRFHVLLGAESTT